MEAGDLGGKASASLIRVASFVPVPSSFVVEPPRKPGVKMFGIPGRVGVVGEG
jgi:hypothetical protein